MGGIRRNTVIPLDTRIYLKSVTFLDSVKPMDLLCAFPSCAPLDSLSVIRGTVELNDGFLQTLASQGMWRNRANMEGDFTDEGIIDYAFADYEDDGRQRVLSVTSSEVTSTLLQKLVKVSGSRTSQRVRRRTYLPIISDLGFSQMHRDAQSPYESALSSRIRHKRPGSGWA